MFLLKKKENLFLVNISSFLFTILFLRALIYIYFINKKFIFKLKKF